MRRPIKECLYCKKPFFIANKTQFYCSKLHQVYAWKKNNRDKDNLHQRKNYRKLHPLILEINKQCIFCQKNFITNPQHKYQKYCNEKCAIKAYQISHREEKLKIDRRYKQNHYQKIKRQNNDYKAKVRFGVTSKTLNKKIVLQRDNYLCRLCGKPWQNIHHIKYSNKVEDLVALCRICHAGVHRKIKQPPYWIGNYKFEEIG